MSTALGMCCVCAVSRDAGLCEPECVCVDVGQGPLGVEGKR